MTLELVETPHNVVLKEIGVVHYFLTFYLYLSELFDHFILITMYLVDNWEIDLNAKPWAW